MNYFSVLDSFNPLSRIRSSLTDAVRPIIDFIIGAPEGFQSPIEDSFFSDKHKTLYEVLAEQKRGFNPLSRIRSSLTLSAIASHNTSITSSCFNPLSRIRSSLTLPLKEKS